MSFHQNQVIKRMIDEELVITTQDFMFNTLNSIARMALFENSPKTEEMVFCLSDLLRYNLEYFEDFPEIQDELNYLKQYLYIQQIRYGERINYHFEVPEQLYDYRMPAFVLLPILEHVFMKRIESKADKGGIYLSAGLDDSKLIIEIKESNYEQISNNLIRLRPNASKPFQSEEVNKVHQRIQSYYGEEYGVFIYTGESDGIKVRIAIPCCKELTNQLKYAEGENLCLH